MNIKLNNKKTLDEIQKIVHSELKVVGFKKRGRTHNRTLENGIIQVVNFQMGQYQFENVLEIPGLRENLYGQFTVNLGVFVPELYEKIGVGKPRDFVQEYNCEIRTRLNQKICGEDKWFPITSDYHKTAEFLVDAIKSIGENWFNRFLDRKRIVNEFTNSKESDFSPRQKLCAAIIELDIDKKNGLKIFNEYFNSIDNKSHKEYVVELANKLNIKIEITSA